MLILHRKKGESLLINENIKITIVDITGEKVKIAIEAPKEIPILRTELVAAAEVNKEAVKSNTLSLNDIKNVFGNSKNKKV
ncbi:MAG: carbon storage regulator [Proteocatella sp.]